MSAPNRRRLDTPAIKALEDELRSENEETLKAAKAFTSKCDEAEAHPPSRRFKVKNLRKQLRRSDDELSEDTPDNGTSLRNGNGAH